MNQTWTETAQRLDDISGEYELMAIACRAVAKGTLSVEEVIQEIVTRTDEVGGVHERLMELLKGEAI